MLCLKHHILTSYLFMHFHNYYNTSDIFFILLFLVLILADYINKNTQLSVCFFYILKILLKLKIKKNRKMS